MCVCGEGRNNSAPRRYAEKLQRPDSKYIIAKIIRFAKTYNYIFNIY